MLLRLSILVAILALHVTQTIESRGLAGKPQSRSRRSALVKERLWPSKNFYYTFDKKAKEPGRISGMEIVAQELMDRTCLTFEKVDRSSSKEKIVVKAKNDGCYTFLGYSMDENNEMPLNLGFGCVSLGTIRHEIQHVLGVMHMQQAVDRDEFVNVNYDLMNPKWEDQYQKVIIPNMVSYFGAKYDLRSNMHYRSNAASEKSSVESMTAKDPKKNIMISYRSNNRFSFYDLMSINNAYKCSEHCEKKECDGYLDKKCKCITKDNPMFGGTIDNPKWPPKNKPGKDGSMPSDVVSKVANGYLEVVRVTSFLPGQGFLPNSGKSYAKYKKEVDVYYVKKYDGFIVNLPPKKMLPGLFLIDNYLDPSEFELEKGSSFSINDNYGRPFIYMSFPGFKPKKIVKA